MDCFVADAPRNDGQACRRSVIKGKTLPDLDKPPVKRVKSVMKAFVVQVKNIADDDHPKKPVVTLQISKNLIHRTTDVGDEVQQEVHVSHLQ
jgi:hypothetical protein